MHTHTCTHHDDVELNVLGCRVDILGTNCDQCMCMVQCCFMATETIRLIRTESPGWPPQHSHSSWTLRPHYYYYYYYTKLLTFYQPKLSGKIQKGWWPGRHWHPPLRYLPAAWPSIWCVKLWLRLKHCWQRLVDCVAGLCLRVRAVVYISTHSKFTSSLKKN